ncbi:hypothetical protein [Variovorax paradoxus]|uniref:hypothetical protein n=1 Tax=Variovorax paradoxus TaxID=34073 RepID=UPI001933B964|nr:hypothetical protein INQ48_18030 [Variovorax paradoxus]
MATELVLRAKPISRTLLSQFCKTPELLKAFENLFFDVAVTIPENVVDNSDEIAAVAAAAAAAQGTASAAQLTATSALSAANTAQGTADALALRDVPLALVDGPVIAVDASQHNSFSVTLGGNRALAAPTGLSDGMLLCFVLRQDATGGRTLSFASIYDFGAAGTPVLSTGPNVVDYAFGYYDAASNKLLMIFRAGAAPAVTSASFSAHNNSVAQSIPSGAFTKLTFSTEQFDTGGFFAGSTWSPPAGKPVMLSGAYTSVSAAGASMTVAVYKNGAEFKRGTAIEAQSTAVTGSRVTCIDIPNGTDAYELWAFQATGSAQNTAAAPELTYFQGSTITP